MLQTYESYKMLKVSKIPKVSELHTELQNILQMFTNKRENILKITEDQMFEEDSVKFDSEVEKWKIGLKNHLVAAIEDEPAFENKIELMKKCDKLELVDLDLDHVYISTFRNLIICKLHYFNHNSFLNIHL